MPIGERLNRTSVGLKQIGIINIGMNTLDLPQSNQRGIETGPHPIHLGTEEVASIEPAWD